MERRQALLLSAGGGSPWLGDCCREIILQCTKTRFNYVDLTRETATLRRGMTRCKKEGEMILLAVMFLVGTVGLLVCSAAEE
jgi:hypothetical protein